MSLEDHPIAAIFPLLAENELAELAKDISVNGVQVPIVMYEGKILDGRNRYRASLKAGRTCPSTTYVGTSAVEHVISLNLRRRHLTPSQSAAVAVTALPHLEAEANKRKLATLKQNATDSVSLRERLPLQEPKPESVKVHPPLMATGKAAKHAAATVGVSESLVEKAKSIQSASPALFAKVQSGETTINAAKREIKADESRRQMQTAAAAIEPARAAKIESVCDVRVCSCAELFASGIKPDAVITDPPYPAEFLPVFTELAQAAKNVPLVAVMSGQSYLPEVYARLSAHLKYRWTLAYLTPGGQAVQQWTAKVNCAWKPVLLFGDAQEWFGDVSRSAVNDNDKDHHHWGQSESGMADLINRLTKPGQLICDPFVGGGTTAVVALGLNRRFVGCDIDSKFVSETMLRVRAAK